MDVRQLRYFCRILELRSITKAAESLHVSQPSLGMHVRNLEHELHTQLVTRHSRGIQPTDAGQILFERATRILSDIDETKRLLQDQAACPGGTVRLGITPCVDAKLIAKVIQDCAAGLPAVNVEIIEEINPTVIEWVQTDKLDLGVVHYIEDPPCNLACDALNDEEAVLVMCSDCDSPTGETIPFSDAIRYPLAMPALPHRLREWVESSARDYDLEVNLRFEMRSLPVIIELVERQSSCSILPFSAVAGKVADGKLKAFKITEPTFQARMSLIYAIRRPLPRAANAVRSFITGTVRTNIEPRDCVRRHAMSA
jgi:LysR family nitrogen assimilation transcriptional regulator